MADSLQLQINKLVKTVFDKNERAWILWLDPVGNWLPLLRRVSNNRTLGGFPLLEIATQKSAQGFGSPLERRRIQDYIDQSQQFVVYVPGKLEELGWLWAHALLAQECYTKSLYDALLGWGWRPHDLTITAEELGRLALRHLAKDPAQWGSDGLQADYDLLRQVWAGLLIPYGEEQAEDQFVINLAAEALGLPPLPAECAALAEWRLQALAHLLVADLAEKAPNTVPGDSKWLLPAAASPLAKEQLHQWTDSHTLAAALPDLIEAADQMASLGAMAVNATLAQGPFVSQAAERMLFVQSCTRLARYSGKELIQQLLAERTQIESHDRLGLWSDRFEEEAPHLTVPWDELCRLCTAINILDAATPTATWNDPAQAIAWYVEGGWRMDEAGEAIERRLQKNPPELVALVTALRIAYRARWESTLIAWSACWVKADCPIPPDLPSAGSWLKRQLAGRQQATAILALDALRYDLGAVLAAKVNEQENVTRATVTPGRAPLPSITALGMGMALPIAEEELVADFVGKSWQLNQRGGELNLSQAADRRAWWQQQKGGGTRYFSDLQSLHLQSVPAPATPQDRLLVYDTALDKLGHDDELAFQGSGAVRESYLAAIARLRDSGWRRILIVTDHGFIHWASSEEKNAERPAPSPTYSSRRALAYPADTTPATAFTGPHALAPGGRWRAAFPFGTASFRAYGGLGYFHGGAALQEWIIPCIAIEWPQSAQPVQLTLLPMERIMSQQPKVKLQIEVPSLLPEDTMSRQVELLIRSKLDMTILFRSSPTPVHPVAEQKEIRLQVQEGVRAERNTAVTIEVREVGTERQLHSIDSTLMIALSGW